MTQFRVGDLIEYIPLRKRFIVVPSCVYREKNPGAIELKTFVAVRMVDSTDSVIAYIFTLPISACVLLERHRYANE